MVLTERDNMLNVLDCVLGMNNIMRAADKMGGLEVWFSRHREASPDIQARIFYDSPIEERLVMDSLDKMGYDARVLFNSDFAPDFPTNQIYVDSICSSVPRYKNSIIEVPQGWSEHGFNTKKRTVMGKKPFYDGKQWRID